MIPPSDRIPPELCKLTKEPFDDENYLFEPKLDGIRCIAYYNRPHVTLINRSFNDITNKFPDITRHFSLSYNCILDGELVCFGANNIPDFQRMQTRMNRKVLIEEYATISPASFVVFDILSYDNKPVSMMPLMSRKGLLHTLLANVPGVITPILYTIGDGVDTFTRLADAGWEGIVAKPLDSKYRPGQRKEWLKVKASRTVDAYVIGCTHGTGRRSSTFGALRLAEHKPDGSFSFIGEVGTGFTDEDLDALMIILNKRKYSTPTYKTDTKFHVEPFLVRIKYLERTNDGMLRFPVYKGVLGY